jgi:hypothetical protein
MWIIYLEMEYRMWIIYLEMEYRMWINYLVMEYKMQNDKKVAIVVSNGTVGCLSRFVN